MTLVIAAKALRIQVQMNACTEVQVRMQEYCYIFTYKAFKNYCSNGIKHSKAIILYLMKGDDVVML